MQKTQPRTYVIAAFTALLSMIPIAWHIGYSTGLEGSLSVTQVQASKSLMGKIIDITGTTITLQSFIPGQTTRKVTVTTDSATVFEQVVQKDQKVYRDEVRAFDAKVQTAQANDTPLSNENFKDIPLPFSFTPMTLADLSLGESIVVTAAENILSKTKFRATRVTLGPVVLPTFSQ